MTGIKNLFRCFNNAPDRNLADNNIKLNFRKQSRLNFNAAVKLRLALLCSAAENMAHCHTRYSKLCQSVFELFKTRFLADDFNLREFYAAFASFFKRWHFFDLNSLCNRNVSGNNRNILFVISRIGKSCKTCISRKKSVFGYIKTGKLVLL